MFFGTEFILISLIYLLVTSTKRLATADKKLPEVLNDHTGKWIAFILIYRSYICICKRLILTISASGRYFAINIYVYTFLATADKKLPEVLNDHTGNCIAFILIYFLYLQL